MEMNTPPELELLGPGDEERTDKTGLLLFWEGSDEDGDELSYDVYLDTQYPPQKLEARELTEESLLVEGLQRGTIYYWMVVADDGFAKMESEISTFTVKEEEESLEIGDVTSAVVLLPSALVIGVAAAALVMKRREDEEESGLTVNCPDCGDAMAYVAESEDFYCWSCEGYLEHLSGEGEE